MNRNRKNTPSANKAQTVARQENASLTIHGHQYSGPIPPPEILNGFEQITPGSAERILYMAEENGRHQREMEKIAMTGTFRTVLLGQVFGFLIGILSFAACIITLYMGSENTAMTIAGFTITGLVAVFVTGRFKPTNNTNAITK